MATFNRDKIYFFRYRPRLAERLPFWDKQPLMFPLSVSSTHTLGINIHWIDPRFRKVFVENLIELSRRVRSQKRFTQLTYQMIRADMRLQSALKGVRLYINNRASNVKEISKDQVQDYFLPTNMNKSFLQRHKARKVFYPDRGKASGAR